MLSKQKKIDIVYININMKLIIKYNYEINIKQQKNHNNKHA